MGWFSKNWFRKKSTSAQEAPTGSERYRGRPLLILLENYVLYAIEQLPPEKLATLQTAVDRVWGGGQEWAATFRAALGLDARIDDDLRQMWKKNQGTSRESGVTFPPEDFARMVADVNFAHLLDRTV